MTTLVWVIGIGGLLGQGIARELRRRTSTLLFDSTELTWGEPQALRDQFEANARRLVENADAQGCRWAVIWAAGAAVTSATERETAAEMESFRAAISAVKEASRGSEPNGSVFLASSAGGVYAGSTPPPFTEHSATNPLSPYGRLKVQQETLARGLASHGLAVLVGRITNLYGPGQKLEKMQGLLSHLALARWGGRPVPIYVPLETLRDYIYVDDCARLVLASMERLADEAGGRGLAVTKIIGSGHGTTISRLMGYAQAVGRERPRVLLGGSAQSATQAIDLRVRSVVWPDLDHFEKTPLPSGFLSTSQGVLASIQNAPVRR